jgi:hypothetical protein
MLNRITEFQTGGTRKLIATDHSKIKVFNIIMVLALAFALVAGAIAVKTATSVSALNNVPPVAEAGPDQAVQPITLVAHTGAYPLVDLDGSQSFDTDGTIVSYAWTQVATGINADYSSANGWPAAGGTATITTPLAAVTTVSLPSAGLYIFKLTVTDNGTTPHADTASDLVVVVAGVNWFVSVFPANPIHTTWDAGQDSWNGTSPTFGSGITGPWATITHALTAVNTPGDGLATVKQGDRIMVSPNSGPGTQSSGPKYGLSNGFGGSTTPENIVVDKWVTIWSANGRDDILTSGGAEVNPPQYATTISVGSQNPIPDQVVKIIWPNGILDLSKTDGLNAERTGVIFGGDGHGFNLLGSTVGIFAGATVPAAWLPTHVYALGAIVSEVTDDGDNFVVTTPGTSGSTEPSWNDSTVGATTTDGGVIWTYLGERGGANAVDIYQNRIEEPTQIPEGTGPNYIGIKVEDSKAPTVDDNIIHFDLDDLDGSLTGITLDNCDETLGALVIAVVYYLTDGNVFTANLMGGAQVINNVVTLADQNVVMGIILNECPKAWVDGNTVNNAVKKCNYAISIGIGLTDCDHSVVNDNDVTVAVDGEITASGIGISILDSHSVTVSNNTIEVLGIGNTNFALGGLLGVGILVENSPKCTVIGNTVDVDNSATVAQEVVAGDNLGVNALGSDDLADLQAAYDAIGAGKAPEADLAASLAIGIFAHDSDFVVIGGPEGGANKIDVCSQVNLQIANLSEKNENGGAALALGITVLESDSPVVAYNVLTGPNDEDGARDNQDMDSDVVGVHSNLNLTVSDLTTPSGTPTPTPVPVEVQAKGKSGAIGILVGDCQPNEYTQTPAEVMQNKMEVLANADVYLSAQQEVAITGDGWQSSVIGQLDTAVTDMVGEFSEVASSPAVNISGLQVHVDAQFDPDAFAKGKTFVFGIGVAVMVSPAAVVAGNIILSANATLDGEVIAEVLTASSLDGSVVANGASCLTLAIGILDYQCGFWYPITPGGPVLVPTTVTHNLVMSATATSEVSVEAAQIVANSGDSAEAHGEGSAVGTGILVIGPDAMLLANSLHSQPFPLPSDATVTYNSVHGVGTSNLDVHGYNLVSEQLAEADGECIGVGTGITVIGQAFPVIMGNGDLANLGSYTLTDPALTGMCFVTGTGNATGTADAQGLSAEDPFVAVGSMGVGVGIAAVFCIDPQITDNCNFHKNQYGSGNNPGGGTELTPFNPWTDTFVTGMATAIGVGDAIDNAVLVGAANTGAIGITAAAGIGIMVASCDGCFVSENHAQGGIQGANPQVVTATATVYALEQDPLRHAWTSAFAFALANGILLGNVEAEFQNDGIWHIPFCVKESNTFEAGAAASISSISENPDPFVLAAAIDAFILFNNVDVHAPSVNFISPVIFNYNDMPGLLLSGANSVDLGMLVVNLTNLPWQQDEDTNILFVDARYNYWGNPLIPIDYVHGPFNLTGPGGIGFGLGQPLDVSATWFTAFVCYQPWLTVNHEWCLDSHIGKFGKAIELGKCWNTFSVPIALDDTTIGTDPYNTWAGFKALNMDIFTNNIGPAVYWDADATPPQWKTLESNHVLTPLEGYKVYVKCDAAALILASTAETMPTLPVYKGWNLVGPNPPFCDPGICVMDFVSSLVRTSGMDGFTQVISQGSSQHNWSYTIGDWVQDDNNQFMKIGKAYWVYMNGPQTLAGFGFTRLPLYPEHFH